MSSRRRRNSRLVSRICCCTSLSVERTSKRDQRNHKYNLYQLIRARSVTLILEESPNHSHLQKKGSKKKACNYRLLKGQKYSTKMRYVAAYCLAALSGSIPSVKDIEKVLSSVGIDCDAALAKKVVSQLEGKDLEELISEGLGKLGSVPVGGGAVAAVGGGADATVPEEKKEEKVEEPEEESDDDMGFGLFD